MKDIICSRLTYIIKIFVYHAGKSVILSFNQITMDCAPKQSFIIIVAPCDDNYYFIILHK